MTSDSYAVVSDPVEEQDPVAIGIFRADLPTSEKRSILCGHVEFLAACPVTAKEASASRMRSGVSSRRMGWRNAGPANQPATAAKSGGKSNKIRTMRRRRRRIGACLMIREWSQ